MAVPSRLRSTALVAAVAGLGLLVSACGGGPSPQPDSTPGTLPSHPGATAAPPPSSPFATDATLALGLAGEPANWNPLAAPARADPALAVVVDAVLPSAFVTASGLTLTQNDELVSSVTQTAADPATGAPQTIVYAINPRATWSDGVPVTGADFAYTWEAQSGQGRFRDVGGRAFTPASAAGYRQISSVTVTTADPDRVVVRLATPDPEWPSLFDPILPAHVARIIGFDHGFTDPVTSLVSGGPFEVQSYQPGSDVVLVRNPRWWGPAANLATLDISFVGSAAVAATSLEQGQLAAAVTAFTPATVAALRATEGLTVTITDGGSFDDLVLDERAGPLAVRAVRLALILAVDRRAMAQRAAAAGDSAAAPIRNRAFPPGAPGYEDDTGVLDRATTAAPARAEQLLTAAGYVRHGATLTHAGRAVRLTLAVETTSPLAAMEAAAVVGAGHLLGITVTTVGPSVAPAGVGGDNGADFSIVEAPLTASPAVLARTYGTGAAGNLSGYSSPVMDDLLTRLQAAGSTAERDELADQVDVKAWDDAVDLPLLGVPSVLAYQSRYVNLTPAPSLAGVGDDPARWGIPQSA
jgi:peptide/nickel transport system substrate-binding protein